MEWLSVQKIRREAKKGERESILCSIEHHTQIGTATVEELIDARENEKSSIYADYCALCIRYRHSPTGCPLLGEKCQGDCVPQWEVVSKKLRLFYKKQDEESLRDMKAASKELIAQLKSLLK